MKAEGLVTLFMFPHEEELLTEVPSPMQVSSV